MYFPSKTPNQAWDLLEQLGWDSYEHEKVMENLMYPTSDPTIFHANCSSHDQTIGTHILNHIILTMFSCGVILVKLLTIKRSIVHISRLMLIG